MPNWAPSRPKPYYPCPNAVKVPAGQSSHAWLSNRRKKGSRMTDVIIQMSMSLDGYIAGPNDSDTNGLGDGGERLHEWLFAGGAPGEGLTGADQEIFDDLRRTTGAMLTGRRLYDITHGWEG